jgi:uncharacterized Zn-finger protein
MTEKDIEQIPEPDIMLEVWNKTTNECPLCGRQVRYGKETVECPGCHERWRLKNAVVKKVTM